MTTSRAGERWHEARQHLRYAWRSVVRRPLSSLALLGLAGVGIAASTFVASAAASRLVRSAAVTDAPRLFTVGDAINSGCGFECADALRAMDFADWKSFSATDRARYASAWRSSAALLDAGLRDGSHPTASAPIIQIAAVDSAFLNVAQPIVTIGRWFSTANTADVSANAALVSHRFWRDQLGARTILAGQTIRTSLGTFEVVGVLHANFDYPAGTDVWVSSTSVARAPALTERALHAVVRLEPGVDAERFTRTLAQRSLHRRDDATPRTDTHVVTVHPFGAQAAGADNGLWLVLAVVMLMFAAVLVNIGVLCTMRTLPRLRENTIRAALGAARTQLLQPHVYEGLLLTAIAASAALFCVIAMRVGVERVLLERLGTTVTLGSTARLGAIVVCASVIVGLVMTLLPVALVIRAPGANSLRVGTYTTTGNAASRYARELAIGIQLFLSYCLAMGATAFGLVFLASQQVDLGFDARHIAYGEVQLDHLGARGAPAPAIAARQFVTTATEVAAERGDAMWVETYPRAPLSSGRQRVQVEGHDRLSLRDMPQAAYYSNAAYFDVFNFRVVQGQRPRTAAPNTDQSVVINATAARSWWPNENPIGKRVRLVEETFETPWLTVTAVVADQNTSDRAVRLGLAGVNMPMVYASIEWVTATSTSPPTSASTPLSADPSASTVSAVAAGTAPKVRLAARFSGVPERAADILEQRLRERLPASASVHITPRYYDQLLRAGGFERTLANARLLSTSAFVIVIVGLIGIGAGVLQIVALQQREIAVRIALGAPTTRVVLQVTRRIVLLCAGALGVGTVVMLALSGVIAPLLITMRPTGVLPHLALAGGMYALCVVVALLASSRIGKIDLTRALRVE